MAMMHKQVERASVQPSASDGYVMQNHEKHQLPAQTSRSQCNCQPRCHNHYSAKIENRYSSMQYAQQW
ncbi:hypothetical protein AOXY_G22852 [Acipenser oxyrinchus oxyrinchus]|uniref:Uncharacterized protein n=1 Tax=Acipenser oxyrinchus oxyrinchus TaxID=40147 RepID=A0AAD8FVL8_ACIOX|nr:hypothetical protein AOXY_G22852 [Acipenser oxyrinchus oxyrinchus]